MKKSTLVLCLALALVVVAAVGGTLAWLTDTTEQVVNTFSPSDIDITLAENKTDFKMVPGYTIDKDPKVTVKTGMKKCYLFVKLEESTNFDSFLTYEIDDDWTALDGVDNVYYMVIDQDSEIGVPYSVLAGDKVTVKDTVTKEMMNGLTTPESYPKLTVTAYASQLYKNNNASDNTFSVSEAWQNCPGNAPTP